MKLSNSNVQMLWSPLIGFNLKKTKQIFLIKMKGISKSFSYHYLKIQAFLLLASKHFPLHFCPCTPSCSQGNSHTTSERCLFSSSERRASLDLSAIFHQHNIEQDSFFILTFEMLKKPCLMTHIEQIFLEFEYATSSIFKIVGFLCDVQW